MYERTQSRIYGSGILKHLKNQKIFQPVFRKKTANKIDPESSKIMNHETPEAKVKQLLDSAFENTKSESHKRRKHTLNDIDHSIPATHHGHSSQPLNPIVTAEVSGEESHPPKKKRKIKKNPVSKKKQVKKSSIFDNY